MSYVQFVNVSFCTDATTCAFVFYLWHMELNKETDLGGHTCDKE